jgi:hypothetical protein
VEGSSEFCAHFLLLLLTERATHENDAATAFPQTATAAAEFIHRTVKRI